MADPEAEAVVRHVKSLLSREGAEEVSDSDAILWLADTINAYVDEIQRLKDELNLYKNSVPVEAMR